MRSVLTALCLFTSTAHAVPAQFTHQGRLLDADGAPLEDETTITFRVTDSGSGGTALWEETITLPLTGGFYSAILGADEDNPLDTATLAQAPVWLELQIIGEDAMFPRSPINAVPYATMAMVAEEISGGPVDASQIAVDGTPVVNELGEWVGPAPTVNWTDIEGVPEDFADGIDDDTDTDTDSFAVLGTSCLDGDIPVWDAVATQWACDIDQDMLADIGCIDGQLIRWSGDAVGWICADDADTVLSETEVDAMVSDNGYAMASEIFSGSFLDLVDVAPGLADGDDDTQLTADEVDDIVSDNGYAMSSEVFTGSFTDLTDVPAGLSDGDTTLTESEVDWMVADNGYTLDIDTEALLARIVLLEEQLAEVTDASESGTVMYGDYNVDNSADLRILEGYEEVSGSLAISGNIPNIESLESLTYVGGNLTISNGSALTSLRGLDNLTTIGGTLNIGNDVLTSLDGLGSLVSVNEMSIHGNASLISLAGLDSLTSAEGAVRISSNTIMTSLDGLNNLFSVGELTIYENPMLASVAGLASLTTVGDYFGFNDNESITELTGLEALTSTGEFNLTRNNALLSLEGLSGLTHVNGALDINSNALLPTLTGLDNLTVITDNLTVQRNDTLLSLEGLSGLTSAGGMSIQINENLSSMSGLDSLGTLTGTLTIFANDSLCRSTALSFLDWALTLGLEGSNINSNDTSC